MTLNSNPSNLVGTITIYICEYDRRVGYTHRKIRWKQNRHRLYTAICSRRIATGVATEITVIARVDFKRIIGHQSNVSPLGCPVGGRLPCPPPSSRRNTKRSPIGFVSSDVMNVTRDNLRIFFKKIFFSERTNLFLKESLSGPFAKFPHCLSTHLKKKKKRQKQRVSESCKILLLPQVYASWSELLLGHPARTVPSPFSNHELMFPLIASPRRISAPAQEKSF